MFRLPDLSVNIKLQNTSRDMYKDFNKVISRALCHVPEISADPIKSNSNKSRQRLAQNILKINNTAEERATPAFEHSQFDQRKFTNISDKLFVDSNRSSLRICKTNSRSNIVGKHQTRKSTDL